MFTMRTLYRCITILLLVSLLGPGLFLFPSHARADETCAWWEAADAGTGDILGVDPDRARLEQRIRDQFGLVLPQYDMNCVDSSYKTSSVTGAVLSPLEIAKSAASKCSFDLLADIGIGFLVGKLKSAASGLGGLVGLGGEVPTSDSTEQGISQGHRFDDCLYDLLDRSAKIAVARFTERVLEMAVDDLTDWIQNSGDEDYGGSKVLGDPGKIFRDSLSAAAGDTLIELGGAQLCSGLPLPRLQVQLKRTVFTERVSCTLNQVVSSTEAFYRDFTTGGWIGYTESLLPQNNQWGLDLLVQNELLQRASAKAEGEAILAGQGGGVGAGWQCTKWIAVDENSKVWDTVSVIEEPLAETLPDGADRWICAPGAGEIITPAGTVLAFLEAGLYAQAQQRADTGVTPYLAAIRDSAFNRVKKEGLKYLTRRADRIEEERAISEELEAEGREVNSESIRKRREDKALLGVNEVSTKVSSPGVRVFDTDKKSITLRIGDALRDLAALSVRITPILAPDPLGNLEMLEDALLEVNVLLTCQKNFGIDPACPHSLTDRALLASFKTYLTAMVQELIPNLITELNDTRTRLQALRTDQRAELGTDQRAELGAIAGAVRGAQVEIKNAEERITSIVATIAKVFEVGGSFQNDLAVCTDPDAIAYQCDVFSRHL